MISAEVDSHGARVINLETSRKWNEWKPMESNLCHGKNALKIISQLGSNITKNSNRYLPVLNTVLFNRSLESDSDKKYSKLDIVAPSLFHREHESFAIKDVEAIDIDLANEIKALGLKYGYSDNC